MIDGKLVNFWQRPAPPPKPPFLYRFKLWRQKLWLKLWPPRPPETEKWWTILYYGARGSGKTLHQAKVVLKLLKWLKYFYAKNPQLNKAIVYSIQKFSPEIEKDFSEYLYYWRDGKELRYCPRKNCWKGNEKHRLHGCYLIFDDMATILPSDHWQNTPVWFRKLFAQARHFGIRILANCQDPFSVDINFRRYVDMCFRFNKVFSSPDPEETKKSVKRIYGIYVRRQIKAEWLWEFGDMTPPEIAQMKEAIKAARQTRGKLRFYSGIWKASPHWISKKICQIYDTTQDVPAYRPSGYSHIEYGCISPEHNHTDKKAPNYCGYKKVIHELV